MPLLYNQTRCIAMRQQVQPETLAYAIAYLTERGYVFGVHFVESTAEALAGEIALLRGFSARPSTPSSDSNLMHPQPR